MLGSKILLQIKVGFEYTLGSFYRSFGQLNA